MNHSVPLLLALAAAAVPHSAAAQAYPTKSLRFVVPFAPGGNSDRMARMIGQKLTEKWGQTVVVDNRAGAGGTLGADLVAKAPADGYTLLLGTFGSIGASAALYKKLPYDPVKDFAAITLIATPPLALVVHPSLPAKSVKELVAAARQKPGAYTYASSGNGSSNHLIGELFNSMAGVKLTHVPYKGASPALIDVLAGRVQVMFAPVAPALPHVRSEKLVMLAVTTARRSSALPDVPTVAEAGVAGFAASGWDGVLAPANTPKAIVSLLNREIVGILNSAEVRKALEHEGADVIASTPEQFSAFIRAEVDKWRKLVRELGVVID
jgi:tripartite-type tricarboxylate transporter receptor subunit TctC